MTDSGDETARRDDVLSRRALLQAGIAAPAGLALFGSHALRAAAKPVKRVADVIVIGSGLAGLGAAATLKALEYNVLVLEGRGRIGGRTWTSTALGGLPLDIGASQIHGVSGNPITDLAQRSGVDMVPLTYDTTLAYDGQGYALSDAQIAADAALAASDQTRLQALRDGIVKAGGSDISVADAIAQMVALNPPGPGNPAAADYAIRSTIEDRNGADPADLSLLHYDDGRSFPGTDVMLRTGFGPIVQSLATGLDIRLAHTVRRIDYGSSGVTVTTPHGRFEAGRVVVTVPLGVLLRDGITFSPGLPARKTGAMDRLAMGVLDRVYLLFAQRFWPAGTQKIVQQSAQEDGWNTWYPLDGMLGQPVLLGLKAGNAARSAEAASDEQIVASAMDGLRRIYGSTVQPPVGHLLTRWGTDALTGGSYSYPRVGADGTEHAVLAEPVGNRLYFAGEHTSTDFPGTVHGAYLSGVREAQRIDGV